MRVIEVFALVTFIVFKGLNLFGQPREYVIKFDGDTVFGDVRLLNNIDACRAVYVDFENGKTEKFRPWEVQKYTRLDGEKWQVYEPMAVERPEFNGSNIRFARIVLDGPLQLMRFEFETNIGPAAGFALGGMVGGAIMSSVGHVGGGDPRRDYYAIIGTHPELLYRNRFNDIMSRVVKDNERLSRAISRRELNYLDLLHIVRIYNKDFSKADSIKNFVKGHIKLMDGTIHKGYVKRLSEAESSMRVIFLDEQGIPDFFPQSEIHSYKRGDQSYILTEHITYGFGTVDSLTYMAVLVDGEMDLLAHNTSTSRKPLNQASPAPGGKVRTDLFLVVDNSLWFVEKKKFHKLAPKYFEDHPELVEKISTKKLKYKDLKVIVEEYNRFKASE